MIQASRTLIYVIAACLGVAMALSLWDSSGSQLDPAQSVTADATNVTAPESTAQLSVVLAQPPAGEEAHVAVMPSAESQHVLNATQFRDSSHFIDSPIYNPNSLTLNQEQLAALNQLLSDIDNSLRELKSKLHSAAARRVPDMIAHGYVRVDPGNGEIDRIGPKELRVFCQANGLQYYFDVERNQFDDLDAILIERDELVETGSNLIKEFFLALPKGDK
jgi:hypothetical protein